MYNEKIFQSPSPMSSTGSFYYFMVYFLFIFSPSYFAPNHPTIPSSPTETPARGIKRLHILWTTISRVYFAFMYWYVLSDFYRNLFYHIPPISVHVEGGKRDSITELCKDTLFSWQLAKLEGRSTKHKVFINRQMIRKGNIENWVFLASILSLIPNKKFQSP